MKRSIIASLWLVLAGMTGGCIGRVPGTVEVVRDIPYAEDAGQRLRLDIYEPKQRTGKLPVVVWIHGGAWNSGSKEHCPIGFMAAKNLAIVSIDYTLTERAPFPAPLFDCKGAIRWLRAHAGQYDLDPGRIGIFGASAGGHLALLLATTAGDPRWEGDAGDNLNFSSAVQCGCAFYPPTDLNRLVTNPKTRADPQGDVARLIGGAVDENVDKANAASPITYVSKNCPPIFLMHGGADPLVPPEQSRIFYAALLRAGVPAQLEIIPGKGHGIIAPPPVAQEIYQFFGKYLEGGAAQADK